MGLSAGIAGAAGLTVFILWGRRRMRGSTKARSTEALDPPHASDSDEHSTFDGAIDAYKTLGHFASPEHAPPNSLSHSIALRRSPERDSAGGYPSSLDATLFGRSLRGSGYGAGYGACNGTGGGVAGGEGGAGGTLGRIISSGRLSAEAAAIATRILSECECEEIRAEDLEYNEEDTLGSGGFGTVYRGWWRGRHVAIKVLYGIYGVEQRDFEDFLR